MQDQHKVTALDKSDFDDWLNNPITKELYSTFIQNKEFLKEAILELDPIFDSSLSKKLAYIRGKIDVCDSLLNLTFDDLFTIEEEKSENEETPYSW